jgi:PAS domain S-box-containing protein
MDRLVQHVGSHDRAQCTAWLASPDGMRVTDADGRILDVNPAYCRLVGLSREELIGRSFTGVYLEEDRAEALDLHRQIFLDRPSSMTMTRRIRCADGRTLTVELMHAAFQQGTEPALITFCRDFTHAREFQEELWQRAHQQQAVAEIGQIALSGLDCDALFREAVRRVAEILNVDHCGLVELEPGGEWLITRAQVGFADEVPHQTRISARRTHAGLVLETGRPCLLEDLASDTRFADSALLRANGISSGVTVPIAGSPRPFGALAVHSVRKRRFGEDHIHFLQSVANVLAAAIERRRGEEKLERALAEAREATELKSRFLANMSHEIRTPMNGIMGTVELLMTTGLNPEQREYAGIIRTSTEALLAVLSDILDLSRIEAGRIELESVIFDPVETVKTVLALLSVRAQAKGLAMKTEFAPDLPRRVRGDPTRFRQVLMKLVGNAIKFTQGGWVETTVSLDRASEAEAEIRVRVRDTGAGIAPQHRERIFENFTQIDDSTTRRHGGTGLGLPIARQLVELMGGRIGVDTEVGWGSIFWFTTRFALVPNKPTVEMTQPKSAQSARGPGAMREAASWRILLAEDNPVNRKVACRILQEAGFAVDAVTNGREAVEALEVRAYDVVLMDVQMPEMDGYEATRTIRGMTGERSQTPVLAMTANAMAGDRELCLKSGMDDYISKPVRPEDLRQAVLRWLNPGPMEMPA